MIHVHEYKEFQYAPSSKYDPSYVDLERLVYLLDLPNVQYTEFKNKLTKSEIYNFVKTKKPRVYFLNADLFSHYNPDDIFDISDSFPETLFVFFDHETTNFSSRLEPSNNCILIMNSFEDYKNTNSHTYNYYFLNSGLQGEYNNFMNELFRNTYPIKRTKKYNFFNGVHKPHRLACYELIKKNDLIDEGYFSYMDYTRSLGTENERREISEFFGFNDDEYIKYISQFEIPYLCDTNEPDPNVYKAFLVPPQISLSSYIYISTETRFITRDAVSTSEKSYKGFLGFNIPLIFGQKKLYKYLKDMGFDMFDDFFDTTECVNDKEMFEQFDRNLKKIKEMSLQDIHLFYLDNFRRLENNFSGMIHSAESQLETIRDICLKF